MTTKTILILQGGGALGAYECGVYQTLAPQLNNLAVVAGTSIGAINASLIAKHYKDPDGDRGRAVLKHFWAEELANPSWTDVLATLSQHVVPPFFDAWQRWSAVWTSLLCGNPRLYTPSLLEMLFPFVFRSPVCWWSETHFYNTQRMEETVRRYLGSYGPKDGNPRLIVTAVDIQEGTSQPFGSYEKCITAAHVVACGSLPPMFPPKEIEGKYYWDGGLWSNTPLPEVLNALQGPELAGETDPGDKYHVYIVDVFPRKGCVPQTNWDVWSRISQLTYADKTGYDLKASIWLNQYIEFVKTLYNQRSTLPEAARTEVEEKYNTLIRSDKRLHLDFTIICRHAYPNVQDEYISREMDFSPDRIGKLMEQGRSDAEKQLELENNKARP